MNKTYSHPDNIPRAVAKETLIHGCLVLEGGAFRSVYEAGVLDALMIHDINLDCVIGVSAGALNGMNYVAGQIGRSAYVNLKYRHDSRYVGLKAIHHNAGIIGFDFAFNEINKEYPFHYEHFNRPEQRFIAVATNCLTGCPAYFEKGKFKNIFQAVRASASLPYLSKIVDIQGEPYLDGGCSDKIPFKWAIKNQYNKIIVIRTLLETIVNLIKAQTLYPIFIMTTLLFKKYFVKQIFIITNNVIN